MLKYRGSFMSQQDQSPSKDTQNNGPELSKEDQAVLDRIFGDAPEAFAAETDRDDAVLNLLNLLDAPVASELQKSSRISLIQVLASRLEAADDTAGHTPELSQADQRALDQYIEQGYTLDGIDADLQERAAKCEQLGQTLTGPPASSISSSEDLVNRTLGTIQSHIDAEESSFEFAGAGRGTFTGRWSDLISLAAMLLIVGSITMPILSGVRSKSQKEVCLNNMHANANAFGLYAGANRDMLPMATAGFGSSGGSSSGSSTWMDVGSTPERSNSSNLFTLVRTKNADLDDLACPSNPNALTGEPDPDAWDWNSIKEISYSYRIMPPGGMKATAAGQPVRVVLLADRSPVVLRISEGKPVIPEANSPNHNASGQHMLMLDGATQWTTSPVINDQDNIWLPRQIEQVIHTARSKIGLIKGSELPEGPTDAFVGP